MINFREFQYTCTSLLKVWRKSFSSAKLFKSRLKTFNGETFRSGTLMWLNWIMKFLLLVGCPVLNPHIYPKTDLVWEKERINVLCSLEDIFCIVVVYGRPSAPITQVKLEEPGRRLANFLRKKLKTWHQTLHNFTRMHKPVCQTFVYTYLVQELLCISCT